MTNPPIGRLDHVGIAVRSIEKARAFFEGALGATFRFANDDPGGAFRFAVFDLAGFTIELLEPIDPAGFLAVFLEKRGEGVHHITLQTPELRAKVERLEQQGIRVVDKHLDTQEFLDAFISPRSACGVLFQLAETFPPLDNEPYWLASEPPRK
jgi:methylmalonyl-CoA/ethylmalonyl-CoA epimerase